jgi:Abnormal spindle-like microcephaly-assoc'd, ASPM-SPD-2-Hydin
VSTMPTFSQQTARRSALIWHRPRRPTVHSVVFFLAACISGLQAQSPAPLSIVGPTQARLGGYANYSAFVNGANASVVWSVNGVAGGTASHGTISSSGMYSPGSQIFAGHSVTISAATVSTPVSSASVGVKILNQLPTLTSGSVTPTAPVNNFLLDVHGSNFVAASQLLLAGTAVATIFVSTTELQGAISLPVGTANVNVGVLNPNAAQKSPVTRTLVVQSNAAVSTLTVSPASLAFGNLTIGMVSTQPVTLVSAGTAPVIVNSAMLSGTGFTMSGATFPVTLNPGLALTIEMQFNPTAAVPATGNLSIQSNSSTNGVAVVSFSGTGVPHQASLSWEAPANSAVAIAGYKSYRSTGGSSTYQLLNSSPNPETTYVDSTVQPGVTYDYIVTSVDSSGLESPPTNEVTATIP